MVPRLARLLESRKRGQTGLPIYTDRSFFLSSRSLIMSLAFYTQSQQAQQLAFIAQQEQQLLAAQQQAMAAIEAQAAVIQGSITEGTPLTTQDFDKHTKRTYFVTLEASMNQLAAGTVQATWSADPGQEHIFQRIAGVVDGKPVYQGDTSKGLLLGMKLEAVRSTFPIDIGVNITVSIPVCGC